MKISLFIPEVTQPVDGYTPVAIDNINDIDPASLTEVLVVDGLDYYIDTFELLGALISKLQYGGIIVLENLNIDSVIRSYYFGEINSEELNKILYNGKQSVVSHRDIQDYLIGYGMLIIKHSLNNNKYLITAQRPHYARPAK